VKRLAALLCASSALFAAPAWAAAPTIEAAPSNFHIAGYHQADLSVEYAFNRYKISAQLQNITNSQAVTSITPLKKTNTVSPYDQYYWQAPTNVQISLKASF